MSHVHTVSTSTGRTTGQILTVSQSPRTEAWIALHRSLQLCLGPWTPGPRSFEAKSSWRETRNQWHLGLGLLSKSGFYFQVNYGTGWWFQPVFIFHNLWDNPSHWLILFKIVKTTNQDNLSFSPSSISIFAGFFEKIAVLFKRSIRSTPENLVDNMDMGWFIPWKPRGQQLDYLTGWWFGTFYIFPYIGNNNPMWLVFFRGVETTNQLRIDVFKMKSRWVKTQ